MTFSFTVKDLTQSAIATQVEFDASRIITYEGTDLSTGYPALSDANLAQNYSQTVQLFDIPKQYQTITVTTTAPLTVTFKLVVDECGYYQLDSSAVGNAVSGLFATGFVRVIGCTPPPPTPTPTATPTSTATPTPTPTGSVLATSSVDPTPTGSVLAISTPTTGAGGGSGSGVGIRMILVDAVLLLAAVIAGRRLEPI